MFQASLRPSSGEQNYVSLPKVFCPGCSCCGSRESGSEMCALCRECCLTTGNVLFTVSDNRQHPLHSAHISLPNSPEPQQLQPGQKTLGSDTQFCCPDDGRKDARNMLRNNWLPVNHYLLLLVGLALICLYKMHGHSNIKMWRRVCWHLCSARDNLPLVLCPCCLKQWHEVPSAKIFSSVHPPPRSGRIFFPKADTKRV